MDKQTRRGERESRKEKKAMPPSSRNNVSSVAPSHEEQLISEGRGDRVQADVVPSVRSSSRQCLLVVLEERREGGLERLWFHDADVGVHRDLSEAGQPHLPRGDHSVRRERV
jgi:hypothetical protein